MSNDQQMQGIAAALLGLDASNDVGPACARITSSHLAQTGHSANPVIGIDGRVFFFGPSMERGIGHYTLNHLAEIFRQRPDWRFVFFLEDYIDMPPLSDLLKQPNTSWCRFDDPPPPELALFHVPDSLSIMPAFDSPFRIAPKVPLSVLFLDLIPLVMREYHFDTWAPQTQIAYKSRLRQLRDSGAVILSISENSKRDLVNLAGVPGERIVTVMAGLNKPNDAVPQQQRELDETLRRYGLRRPFFMTVGALDNHKNFPAVANAFVTAKRETPMQLAVVGGNADPYKAMYRDALAAQGIKDVVFTGYVSREELVCLYAQASALIFPSKYEGFGFPVLEAMASGCPVITSNVSSLPEVAGDAAILVGPDDVEGIARGMLALVQNPQLRGQLSARGIKQAERFTWAESARRTIEAWERAMLTGRAVCARP